jgi:hypothetical protein
MSIYAHGTSEGVRKAWDTRGRTGHHLEEKDGALHVTDTYPHPEKPQMLKSWYRVIGHDGQLPMDMPADVRRTNNPGIFSMPGGGIVAVDPKKTPDHAEQFDIPAPKSKMEVRWHDGGWQKKMKSGWKYV